MDITQLYSLISEIPAYINSMPKDIPANMFLLNAVISYDNSIDFADHLFKSENNVPQSSKKKDLDK